jgi:hypothetical protein
MRRHTSLSVEAMEGRALLSGLSASLTTDQQTYQAGQPVEMTFTETNTSDQPISIGVGAVNSGFDVSQAGQVVWESNAGINPMVIVLETLQPGQSLTLHGTWDGVSNDGGTTATTTGSFVVTNQLDPSGASASFQIESPLTFGDVPPQTPYNIGEPIDFSYTVTNTSDLPVSIGPAPTDVSVTMNGETVWQSNLSASIQGPTAQTVLQPGQSVTESATWNGIANEGAFAGTNVWGDFDVSLAGAPVGLGYELLIASPLTQSVVTDQTVYQPGEPVQMTATETNTSDQAITLLNSGDQFSVEGYGGPVLTPTGGAPTNQVVTLQPGQSQTFTATWDESGTQGPASSPTGLYTVLFQDAFHGMTSPQFVINNPTASLPLPNGPPGSTTGSTGSTSGDQPVTPGGASPQAAPLFATLTANHSKSAPGGSVRLTITFDNVSNQAVRLAPNASTDGITVLDGSTVVSSIKRGLLGSKGRTIAAGKIAKFTTVLRNIVRTHGVAARLRSGTYAIEVDEGGYVASVPIRIV